MTSKVNLKEREEGSYAENKGPSEEGAERLSLDAVCVRKADGVKLCPKHYCALLLCSKEARVTILILYVRKCC